MDKLIDLAHTLRSKNAGPLTLTLDIMFSDKPTFDRVINSGVINPAKIAEVYDVEEKDVLITQYAIVNALKVTVPRNYVSGSIYDTDVYGCQQHKPIRNLLIP